MKILLDNTQFHRLGIALKSPTGGAMRAVDALALFHLAEHILFSEGVSVWVAERARAWEGTNEILTWLAIEGVARVDSRTSLVTTIPGTEDEFQHAVKSAGFLLLDHLAGTTTSELRRLGKLADQATQPSGHQPPPLDYWASPEWGPADDPGRLEELRRTFAEGAAELMLAVCRPLLHRLKALRRQNGGHLDSDLVAALDVLSWIYINQELAKGWGAVYSPAPQRARLVRQSRDLFRQKLAKAIRTDRATRQGELTSSVLRAMSGREQLPLPLFAFHALRNDDCGSPWRILVAAQRARDDGEVVAIRDYLTKWDQQLASGEGGQQASKVLDELKRIQQELPTRFARGPRAIVARLIRGLTGVSVSVDPVTAMPTFDLPIPRLDDAASIVTLLRGQHQFLAAIAEDLATDEELGARILMQLNRAVTS